MSAVLAFALFLAAAVGVVAWLDHEARVGEQMLADLGPTMHDQAECPACSVADDMMMQRFDLNLWAIEMQADA